MRRSKRLVCSLLAAVMLLGCLSGTALAAGTQLLSLRGPESVAMGGTVEVLVDAQVEGVVADGKLTVTYDADSLRYVSAAVGEAWQDAGRVVLSDNAAESGKVVLAFAGAVEAGKGTIVKLTFAAIAVEEASSTVSIVNDGNDSSYISGAESYDLSAETTIQIKAEAGAECAAVTFQILENGTFDGSSTVESRAVKVGEPVGTPPAVQPASGYIFSGWRINGSGTVYTNDQVAAMTVETKESLLFVAELTVDPNRPVVPVVPPEPVKPSDTECDGGEDCPTKNFTDLSYTGERHKAADFMVANGYIKGTSATTFSPNTAMNRAMLVTILYRMSGSPAVSGDMPFTDVAPRDYFYDAVMWAQQEGITKGTSATTFSPLDELTREQIAAFLFRYVTYTGRANAVRGDLEGYTDVSSVHDYAVEAMQWAVGNGIIIGTSSETLHPREDASRIQVAVMIWRLETMDEQN